MLKKFFVFVLSLLVASVLFLVASPIAHAAPPENFQLQQIIGSGLNQPSGFEIAPDGRIFILQREGQIRVYKNGTLLETPFADLPSVASGDRGLIGIAFDPAFAIDNHYVYFYYTGLDLRNRLVRFDASGDVGQNPLIIYQTNSPSQELHVGGSIRFGPDGKLYFAVGDNGYPPNAQNLSNPHGKILRINKDGSIPLDNPFYGQQGSLPEIWAYGFRNPWRFQFDSVTGRMYGGDVGDYTWEEVNHIVKGGNYGWPAAEGMCTLPCNNYTNPIYYYIHQGDFGSAVTGGSIYHGGMFPQEYDGDYFFGDYGQGFIRRMDLDAAGNNIGVSDFDPNAGTVVDMKVAPDGSLYYLTIFPGVLYRVSYATDSHLPIANATADVTKGIEPLTVTFSSAGSSDPDNDPIAYLWNFGDGTTSTQANPTKTFTEKGTYTVQLTVSDATDASQAVPIVIQVGQPPVVTIGSPVEGDLYRATDEIQITAHAVDAAGLDLNDAAIKTEVFLHHNTHIHPFLGPLIGRAHSFTTPDHGEASADTWFEIKVTATDAHGLADTESVNVFPIKSAMTFTTNVPGLTVLLDGSPHATPHVVTGVEKFKREISINTVQEVNGEVYVFDHWSDGGVSRHTIITPAEDTTFTVHFRPATAWNASFYNNTELTGAPVLTRQDEKIDYLWENGSPDPVVNTDQFSARWTQNEYFAGGRYTFTTATDDGVRLFVDGALVINEYHGNNAAFNAEIDLTEGMHEITMEYFEGFGMANARLDWDLAATQPVTQPTTSYNAEYFDNKTLTGTPLLTRNDETINFNWENGSPDPQVPLDNFSARWTKNASFEAGVYIFTATADDGVRVKVDGEVIIDKWIDQGSTTYEVEKTLTAGNHTVIVEYYENGGGSVMHFAYEKTDDSTPTVGFAAEYFANQMLTGQPAVTRIDPDINFNWADTAPDATLPINQFSARWTKNETFAEDGTYEFSITADDGVRLSIDNELVLDKWLDQAATTYKIQKALTAGTHTIKVEYYEAWGDAVAKLSYAKIGGTPPPPNDGSYTGEYYNNRDFTPPAVLTRNDATINFDWGGASPDPLVNANDYTVRWTKAATFTDGTYEFTVTADDGVRVKVDEEVIIDKWIDQAPATYKVEKSMTAGQHTVVVEYYEAGGGAVAKFNFQKIEEGTSGEEEPEPTEGTFSAEYFDNINLTGTPVLTRQDAQINFNWGATTSPDPLIAVDNFSVRWTKQKQFAAGDYQFILKSDDGVRFWIDDQLLVDDWTDHAEKVHTPTVTLTEGMHTVKLEYYEKAANAIMVLEE
ncbi:MAG: PA14 domain-containing protein [Patescibacteria group bacterium]